jgi:hypothetical protein
MDGDKVQEYQALKKDVELFPNLDEVLVRSLVMKGSE